MDEDFSNVINKFKSILEEKNIDINSLSEEAKSETNSDAFKFDIATILKIKQLINSAQDKNSPRIKLLEALKPFLAPSSQLKLDELIKLTNIISILEILNENRKWKYI